MANLPFSFFTQGNKSYEVKDAKARTDVANLSKAAIIDENQKLLISENVTSGSWTYHTVSESSLPTKNGYKLVGFICRLLSTNGVAPCYHFISSGGVEFLIMGRSTGASSFEAVPIFVKN